jgi:hypothetical protein
MVTPGAVSAEREGDMEMLEPQQRLVDLIRSRRARIGVIDQEPIGARRQIESIKLDDVDFHMRRTWAIFAPDVSLRLN